MRPPHLYTLSLPAYKLTDSDVQALLRLPALVRLEVGLLLLCGDHSAAASNCTWREIILGDASCFLYPLEVNVVSLARLPLRTGEKGGGVVKLGGLCAACDDSSAEELASAVRHLLSLQGWRYCAMAVSDSATSCATSYSEETEHWLGKVDLWVNSDDAERAAAAMQLVVAMQDVDCLTVESTHRVGLEIGVVRAVLSAVSHASTNASTLPWTSVGFQPMAWQSDAMDDDEFDVAMDQLCAELLPALTAALPRLEFMSIGGIAPPERVAALCAAPGIRRPIRLLLEHDWRWTDARTRAHAEEVQQAVAAAVAAAGVPSYVTILV
jgi:hypothetical protein